MIRNDVLEDASIHEWLRHETDNKRVFHAYLARTPGTPSLCGKHPSISRMREMDIPGDVSVCCVHCFFKLYRINPPMLRG